MQGSGSGHSRRQWIALILSGVFPGLGQLFLRSWGKGVALLLAVGVLTWAMGDLVSLEDLLAGRVAYPLVTLAFGARPRGGVSLERRGRLARWKGAYDVAGISDASPRRTSRLVNAATHVVPLHPQRISLHLGRSLVWPPFWRSPVVKICPNARGLLPSSSGPRNNARGPPASLEPHPGGTSVKRE